MLGDLGTLGNRSEVYKIEVISVRLKGITELKQSNFCFWGELFQMQAYDNKNVVNLVRNDKSPPPKKKD